MILVHMILVHSNKSMLKFEVILQVSIHYNKEPNLRHNLHFLHACFRPFHYTTKLLKFDAKLASSIIYN